MFCWKHQGFLLFHRWFLLARIVYVLCMKNTFIFLFFHCKLILWIVAVHTCKIFKLHRRLCFFLIWWVSWPHVPLPAHINLRTAYLWSYSGQKLTTSTFAMRLLSAATKVFAVFWMSHSFQAGLRLGCWATASFACLAFLAYCTVCRQLRLFLGVATVRPCCWLDDPAAAAPSVTKLCFNDKLVQLTAVITQVFRHWRYHVCFGNLVYGPCSIRLCDTCEAIAGILSFLWFK